MELQYISGVSHTIQTVTVILTFFAAWIIVTQVNHKAQLARLPVFFQEGSREKRRIDYMKSAKKIYVQGYEQFKDSVYRIATTDGVASVVVPPHFLPELRKLPDSVLSFPKAVDDNLEAKYTKIKTNEPIIPHAIKADLTPALVRLNPLICAEVAEAMSEEMPSCEEWTGVHIYMKLVTIVAKVSGRIFVGPELCRDQKYLDAGINFTLELVNAQRAIKRMRPWLRPFLAPRLPEVVLLQKRRKEATEFLRPVVQARHNAEKNPNYQKPDDMLQWLMDRSVDYKIDSTAHLAILQLNITFAAIHTTSVTATNVLYTLASEPKYIQPLREEIRAAIADNDGVITSRALQSMPKLDSFMKETVRFYALGFTSFTRKVLKGITLSNGQYIPAGASIETPSNAVYQDDANYPDCAAFDGFRFAKIREAGSTAENARNQFVTTNEQNLFFGYGKHACPGRFFAANEIKMILACTILEYDIKNVDDAKERIPNLEYGREQTPDATKQLMFKKAQP